MESKRKAMYVVIGVIVGVLMVGTLGMMGGRPAQGPEAAGPAPATTPPAAATVEEVADPAADAELEAFMLSLPKRDPADPAARGDVDAPVVMTEWADYRCPFCSVFVEETYPQLAEYFDEGLVRFEFRDMAIFGEESSYAAVAARAAGRQGLQLEFMEALYRALPNEGHPVVDEAIVTEVAAGIGVPDMERFVADLASPELAVAVQAESTQAAQLGLGSVPAFVIGTQLVQGAQPLEVFQQVIEQELAKAGA